MPDPMAAMPALSPAVSFGLMPAVMPAFPLPGIDWKTLFPLVWLGGSIATDYLTNQWVSFMEALWAGALWMVQFAFTLVDAFTTPDLSQGGPMGAIYPATFAIGGALALVLAFVQIGFGAWQRDGRGLARVLVGVPQFGLAWAGMLGVGALLTVATSGLTQGLLQLALGSPSFGKLNLLKPWQPRDGVDAAVAAVLGICGFLLILAAIGYLLIMLVRAGALMLLMATSPISAAGLVAEGTRAWFWKSLRWFVAALMIAPLSALILGIGTKLTEGVVSGAGDATVAAVGQGVVGTILVIIGAFAPLVLFRLLAFVDPGTSSGQSFRASLDAAGGLGGLAGGLLSGKGSGGQSDGTSGAATSTASDGTGSQGEADAAATTQGRLASALGPAGTALGSLSSAGQAAAGFAADVLGAAGVGHPQPYFATPRNGPSDGNRRSTPSQKPRDNQNGNQTGSQGGPDQGPTGGDPAVDPPPTPAPTPLPVPGTPGSGNGAGLGGSGGPGSGRGDAPGGGNPGAGGGGAAGGAGAAGGVEGAAAVAAL